MAGEFWIKCAVSAALAVAVLVSLDRGLLWAQRRGWIYYRRRKPSRSALGSAFLEVQSIFEADKRHVLEVRRQEHREEDGEAAWPHGGAGADAPRDARSPREGSARGTAADRRSALDQGPHELERRPSGAR